MTFYDIIPLIGPIAFVVMFFIMLYTTFDNYKVRKVLIEQLADTMAIMHIYENALEKLEKECKK
jgi:hypothetical protein